VIAIKSLDDITLMAESSVFECKPAGGKDGNGELPKDFRESYSALANTAGGVILLGLSKKMASLNCGALR